MVYQTAVHFVLSLVCSILPPSFATPTRRPHSPPSFATLTRHPHLPPSFALLIRLSHSPPSLLRDDIDMQCARIPPIDLADEISPAATTSPKWAKAEVTALASLVCVLLAEDPNAAIHPAAQPVALRCILLLKLSPQSPLKLLTKSELQDLLHKLDQAISADLERARNADPALFITFADCAKYLKNRITGHVAPVYGTGVFCGRARMQIGLDLKEEMYVEAVKDFEARLVSLRLQRCAAGRLGTGRLAIRRGYRVGLA